MAPYTLEPFGGMLAYLRTRDAKHWQTEVAKVLAGSLPADRLNQTGLASRTHTTTIHERDVDLPLFSIRGRYRTDVIHLMLEFEADPSLR